MKKCKKITDLMPDVLGNNTTLSEKELEHFHAHLTDCDRCSEEYTRMAGLMATIDKRPRPQMSDDFWDNYYSRLEEKLDCVEKEMKPAMKIKSPGWMWVLYPVAAAAVLVVGVAVAQFFSLPGNRDLVTKAVSSIRQLNPAVASHFDNVQPLLVDYSNYSPEEDTGGPEETVMVEKSTIQKLLLENQLLKQLVAKEENITTQRLMEELELILLELKNANGDGIETRRAVQQLIKDNDILFKMKTLKKKKGKSATI